MRLIHRRTFLRGAAASAAALAFAPWTGAPWAAPGDPHFSEAALIELSRDATGCAHIAQAALVSGRDIQGSLPLSLNEIDALRQVIRSGDFTRMQTGGLWAGQQRFVFVDARDGGLRGVRPGGFVTARLDGPRLVVATAGPGMVHGRAVEAVYQLMRLSPVKMPGA